jgi:sorbitol-6-phosphate 2-dehydrogenase
MRSVTVEGVGGFLLGEDYDDALNGTSAAPKAVGRAAVVHNKVCVVTGGAQGFGEGIVRELVKNGALVFIADMNVDGAVKLAAELNEEAGRTVAFGICVNVTDEASVQAMMRQVVETAGGVDLFISNAGVLKAGSVKEMSLRDFEFVTDVNYIGFFLCTKHAAPVMERMNKPLGNYFTDIICISSKSALEGSNKNGAYAGSKFGSVGLVQSFAKELVADNTKVNTICPGNFFDGPLWSDPEKGLFMQYLQTGKVPGAKSVEDVRRFYEAQIPMGRGCDGADVTKAILYSVEQKYETGQAIPVTGGQVMLN